jgi:hypothetical protein
MFTAAVYRLIVGVSGTKPNLVNLGNYLGSLQQRVNMMGPEIADANGAYPACFVQFFEGFPGFRICFLPVFPEFNGIGPMNKVQIKIIQAKFFQAEIKGPEGCIVPMFIVPQFGSDKKLLPGNAALSNSLSHAFLIAVCRSGIDMAVPLNDSFLYRTDSYRSVRGLPSAETDAGDFNPIA